MYDAFIVHPSDGSAQTMPLLPL